MAWLLFFTRCDVFCDLLQYTHRKHVLYSKNSNGLLKDFWGMKKEKQVYWRDLTWIWRHQCVCPLIDHGQQPMKMHTEVTSLLYKYIYMHTDHAVSLEYIIFTLCLEWGMKKSPRKIMNLNDLSRALNWFKIYQNENTL